MPNGGLSAARNVGLAEATGEIVAYTDADVARRSGLAHLSGPAVPHLRRRRRRRAQRGAARRPADGAVHRARAGRTDARPARRSHRRARARLQHGVPARRAARHRRLQSDLPPRRRRCGCVLAAAGAGLEDRVRARPRSSGITTARRSARTGASRSATARARRWLMAHHPEKFLDGHMLWRGRIYSPLPFVRSLWGTRINAGVWGTAAFPSVYRTDVHPFAFLPHSIRWQVLSLAAHARRRARGGHRRSRLGGRAAARLGPRSAWRRRSRRTSRTRCGPTSTRCRQPSWYRRRSRICISSSRSRASRAASAASSSPPEVAPPAPAQTSRGPRRRRARLARAACCSRAASPRIGSGARPGRRPSASLVAADRLAAALARRPHDRHRRRLVARSRRQRAGRPLGVARRARADEDHGGGQTLLRISTHLRPTLFGVARRVRARPAACSAARRPAWRCAGRRPARRPPPSPSPRSRSPRGGRRRRRRSSAAPSRVSPAIRA